MTLIDLQHAREAPALSIKQPWAELILRGQKDVELRRWTTPYRGLLWLHAGKNLDQAAVTHFRCDHLFTGGLVGLAELVDIRALSFDLYEAWRPRHLDLMSFPHEGALFGWVLKNVRRLDPPRPLRGALGLFANAGHSLQDDELERLLLADPL